jgi:thiol:disulfide interchange protein DsbD
MYRITVFLILLAASPCYGQVAWIRNYSEAQKIAVADAKPIFIDFYADWCTWCHKLDREVYSDPDFIRFLQAYVPLRIDIEDPAEGKELAGRFQVQTLPTIMILDTDGHALNRIGGYRNASDLIADISSIQELLRRERMNPEDWHTIQTLAEEYLFRDLNREAEVRFQRVLAAPVNSGAKESAHFSLALTEYYQGKIQEALQTLNTYLETYVDGRSAPDVFLLLSQIYLELNEADRARGILQKFLRKFPGNANAARAKEILEKL